MEDKYAIIINSNSVVYDTDLDFEDAIEIQNELTFETTIINMEDLNYED